MKTIQAIVASLLLALLPLSALAVQPDEVLTDPAMEARARALSAQLRCLVCQNQSIDDSDAPLAKDLRLLVRKRLTANDTDQQVMDYIVARYGDFVLLKPPMKTSTMLLWLAPLLALLCAIWLAVRSGIGPSRVEASAPLSTAEREKLEALTKEAPPEK